MSKPNGSARRPKKASQEAVQESIFEGAILLEHGFTREEASLGMELGAGTLTSRVMCHPDTWKSARRVARRALETADEGLYGVVRRQRADGRDLRLAAIMAAAEMPYKTISRKLGREANWLRLIREKYPRPWAKMVEEAKQGLALAGWTPPAKLPTPDVLNRLRQGAVLVELFGFNLSEASKRLGLSSEGLRMEIKAHDTVWKSECELLRPLKDLSKREGSELRWPSAAVQKELSRAAKLVAKDIAPMQVSRSLGHGDTWLEQTSKRYFDFWKITCMRAGIDPKVWRSEFKGMRMATRRRMIQGSRIVASGIPMTEAAERMGLPRHVLQHDATGHNKLWNAIVAEERKALGIPEGHRQRAREYSGDGQPIKRRKSRNGPRNVDDAEAEARGTNGRSGSANSANSANKSRIFPQGPPANDDLVKLAAQLEANAGSGKSRNQIAREFTGETKGKNPTAQSLLAQIRRLAKQGKCVLP